MEESNEEVGAVVDLRHFRITDAGHHRRALALLGASPDGCMTTLLYKYGFKPKLINELLTAGLATAQAKRSVADGKIDDLRIRITDIGRAVLER